MSNPPIKDLQDFKQWKHTNFVTVLVAWGTIP